MRNWRFDLCRGAWRAPIYVIQQHDRASAARPYNQLSYSFSKRSTQRQINKFFMPTTPKTLLNESKLLFLLALPLIGSGVIDNSLGFFSTIFLAHLSQEALAAGALVGWMFATLMVIMWGALSAIATLVSHRHGAKDHLGVSRVLRDGMIFAVCAAIPSMLLIWHSAPILLLIGQNPQMVALAQPYFHSLTWAIFPDLIFTVLLHFVTGLGHMRTNLFFITLWVPINIFLNYILIFGKFGAPALGIAGIGWGMTISFWIVTTLMAIYILLNKNYRIYCLHAIRNQHPSSLKELLRTGLPIGLMFCLEIAFFTSVTLIMGTISSDALAANQITLQFLGQFSVVSFCFAQAVTVRMGHCLGAGDPATAERAGYLGMLMALFFMCIAAVIYWTLPQQLISIDLDPSITKNSAVIEIAKQLLMICAFFQIFESIRISAFGALRALKDTRFTLLITILTFWIIAIPLGYFLAIKLHWEGNGLWWGIVTSQFIGAIILVQRYRYRIKSYFHAQ